MPTFENEDQLMDFKEELLDEITDAMNDRLWDLANDAINIILQRIGE